MLNHIPQYAHGFDDDPGLVDDNPDLKVNCGHCGHEHICDPDDDGFNLANIRDILKGI
jgi:hypothetical protein